METGSFVKVKVRQSSGDRWRGCVNRQGMAGNHPLSGNGLGGETAPGGKPRTAGRLIRLLVDECVSELDIPVPDGRIGFYGGLFDGFVFPDAQ